MTRIAIVGMAGRFPGARDLREFWELLRGGVCSLETLSLQELRSVGVSADDLSNPRYIRTAAAIAGYDSFDIERFGYSPREAGGLDPQHRVFLETCLTALEDAAVLRDGCIAVFAGAGGNLRSYASALGLRGETGSLAHVSTDKDFLATRVSFELGLSGPSLSVQTSTSSSLVAVHLACRSLLDGECDVALAGGVSVRVPHRVGYFYEDGGVLSADGVCRPLSMGANGTVFGSGAGVVVLKRLEDALADGDRIRAVILGSAVAHDGGGKDSYVISSSEGVARVASQALARARVEPQSIGLVEAHATGTVIGDPIEFAGLSEAYGGSRLDGPAGIGSVKGNIGHLEAAAGVSSLIKAVLSLENQLKPRTVGVTSPNPALRAESSPFRVLQEAEPWGAGATPRRAAVSSLGLGGTNAALILEEAPPQPRPPVTVERPWHLLTVSAPTAAALTRQVKQVAADLRSHPDRPLGDVCYTANVGRLPLAQRVVVAATSADSMANALESGPPWSSDAEVTSPVLISGTPPASPPSIAFLFSGQGQQRLGMAQELFETLPSFRATILECDALMRKHVGRSLVDIVFGDELALHRPSNLQPIFFSLQYALAKLLVGWGVVPSILVGHSFGEYAIGCLAGAFSLEAAMEMVSARGRIIERRPGETMMATAFTSGERVRRAVAAFPTTVGIAAHNSDEEWAISGEAAHVELVGKELEAEGIRFRRFDIGFAGHSPSLEPILDKLEAVASGVEFGPELRFPVVSTLTGCLAKAGDLRSAGYWRRHAREMVRASDALKTLYDFGANVFIEIGPSPAFLTSTMAVGAERGLKDIVGVPTLARRQPDWRRLLETLATLHVRGVDIDWKAFDRDFGRRKVSFPTYAFERQTFNLGAEQSNAARPVAAGTSSGPLGRRIHSPALREQVYEREVDESGFSVFDLPFAPLRFFLEIVMHGAEAAGRPVVVSEVSFLEPLNVQPGVRRLVQTVLRPNGPRPVLEIFSAMPPDEDWTLHCRASFGENNASRTVSRVEIATSPATDVRNGAAVYASLEECGLRIADGDRALTRLHISGRSAIVELSDRLSSLGHGARVSTAFEAATHGLLALVRWEEDRIWLPLGFQELDVRPSTVSRGTQAAWSAKIEIREMPADERTVTADIILFDASNQRVASLTGYCLREVDRSAVVAPGRELSEWSYEVAWEVQVAEAVPLPSPLFAQDRARWVVIGIGPFANEFAAKINELGASVFHVDEPAKLSGDALRNAHGIVNLLPATLAATDSLELALQRACKSSVDIVETLAQSGALATTTSPLFLVVTRGGQPVLGSLMDHNQGLAWGMVRSLEADHPNLRCVNVDLDPHASDQGLDTLVKTMVTTNGEQRIAFRHDRRHVARLVRSAPSRRRLAVPSEAFRADLRLPGQLDNVVLTAMRREAPGPEQVEINAHAHGLSFRDVLTVLGVPGANGPIGFECAGIVTAVGAGVKRFAIGDAVIALSPTQLGSHVLVDERLVARIPSTLSFEQAATIPLAFVLAWHLVHDVACVKPGQRVLVHAVSGAVGQALVQVALGAGARVLATASPTKQHALKVLDIERVFSSRTHEFGAKVLEHTGGAGVDAVFHSLQPRFLATSAECLKADGTLIDFSVGTAVEVGASALARRYVRFDLTEVIRRMPVRLGEILQKVTDAISAGTLEPIPSKTFAVHDLQTAFRRLVSPMHSGKVVVASEVEPLSSIAPRGGAIDPMGTYVVAGGAAATREALATQLQEAGALRVVHLVGTNEHRGDSPSANHVLVDTSDIERVPEKISEALAHHPQIRGVFLLQNFDTRLPTSGWSEFSASFVESATFARAIDEVARKEQRPLDFFFLFSSVSSIIGIPGTPLESVLASYIDGLAHARRTSGLAATAIDWAVPSLELSEQAGASPSHWGRGRVGALAPSRALGVMASMLAEPPAQTAILPILWESAARRHPSIRGQAFFSRLFMESADPRRRRDDAGRIAAELRELPSFDRLPRLTDFVEATVVRALGLRASQRLDPHVGFRELGLDSLLSVELRNRLQEALGLRLPQGITFNHPNVNNLSEFLASKLFPVAEASNLPVFKAPSASPMVTGLVEVEPDDIDSLSAEELERLVRAELELGD